MRRIKMLWDFRGPNAKKIAEHHEVHLKEFIHLEHIENANTGVKAISDQYYTAFMVINEHDVAYLRRVLKPHRGQLDKD